MSEEDIQIERGVLDPSETGLFYPKGVLNILLMLFDNKHYWRPHGRVSPVFTLDEVYMLAAFLFHRAKNLTLRHRRHQPHERAMPLKRQMFIKHYLGEAKYNGAKAARMAGYSAKSAKQIAYKIRQT